MIEVLLLLLPAITILGVPVYIFFRERMVRRKKRESDDTRLRVFKITIINMLLNSAVSVYFFLLFIEIFPRLSILIPGNAIMTIVFMVIMGLTFYGNGIYITSIVLEDYTLPQLRRVPHFKTQFIATHLFHGPISHILIYSGWLLVFFMLAMLEGASTIPTPMTLTKLLVIGGSITGFAYAVAQIYNGTTPYQFITGTILLAIFLLIGPLEGVVFGYSPMGTFYLSLNILFELTLLGYFAFLKIRRRRINWDQSGY